MYPTRFIILYLIWNHDIAKWIMVERSNEFISLKNVLRDSWKLRQSKFYLLLLEERCNAGHGILGNCSKHLV